MGNPCKHFCSLSKLSRYTFSHLPKGLCCLPDSLAPLGFISLDPRPIPKLRAAIAKRLIGRIWFLIKIIAIANNTSELPIIHIRKIYGVEL